MAVLILTQELYSVWAAELHYREEKGPSFLLGLSLTRANELAPLLNASQSEASTIDPVCPLLADSRRSITP